MEVPAWLGEVTVGELMVIVGGFGVVFALVAKAWKPVRRVFKTLEQIGADWNGTPERKDASGEVIAKAQPGVIAQLETLRAQVQNSHKTNLRDDIDKFGVKLDEHIEIAKESDASQGRVEEQLLKFTPMLEDLHKRYAPGKPAGD